MINLMPSSAKQDIRAARRNVVLTRYSAHILLITLLVGAIYGTGFWITYQEKKSIELQITTQNNGAREYNDIQKQAKEFKSNLVTAQQILDKGVPYSTFFTTLAKDLPSGTMISALRLGGKAGTTAAPNGVEVGARAATYEKAIELKSALEQSKLFENVTILSIDRPDSLSGLGGLELAFPYDVKLRAKVSNVTLEPGGL